MEQSVITEKEIPVASTKVNSFINAKVSIMSPEDRSNVERLPKVAEPLFAVREGERNYVYSFDKIFKAITTEIAKVKDRRVNLYLFTFLGFAVWIGIIIYAVYTGGQPQLRWVAGGSFIVGLWSLYELVTTEFKAPLKALDDKKAYVLKESQDYLHHLKEEVKKPVIII